jgi:putative transcriptional regulator
VSSILVVASVLDTDQRPGGDMENEVRDLRVAAGLSQRELAEALAVSRQTVNSIETGRYDPSLPLAIAIARHFHRTVEEIFHVD